MVNLTWQTLTTKDLANTHRRGTEITEHAQKFSNPHHPSEYSDDIHFNVLFFLNFFTLTYLNLS